MSDPPYAELHLHTNFSFLDGASAPDELAAGAAALGLAAVAITDHDGLYGAVRFAVAAREQQIKALFGSEITLDGGAHVTLLARDRRGYGNLCRLLSAAQLGHEKGQASASFDLLAQHAGGLICLSGCPRGELGRALLEGDGAAAESIAGRYRDAFGAESYWLEVQNHLLIEEQRLTTALVHLGGRQGLPLVATNDVHYCRSEERKLQDVLACIKAHTSLDQAGVLLRPNAEWRLKSAAEMAALFQELPEALTATLAIADQCTLDLTRLRPSLPNFDLPAGETPFSYLFRLCHEGARRRYHPITPAVMRQITHELEVIEKLGLAGYFLIVWDVARCCAERGIMAQGRGSAANSAVCYALGITNVDPISQDLLFERFLSEEREGFPDIDLDIAHQDREQVIQYVYNKYGREHAAMVCEVITYRARSAVRDVGKALGLSLAQVDTIAKSLDAHAVFTATPEQRATALAPHGSVGRQLYELCAAIDGFPHHLSIHVGGFVITGEPLVELAPVEPATMADRTVVQWDKDDVETLGFVKFDLLGLGMLTLIDRAVKLVNARQHPESTPPLDLARLDYRDAAVYDMLGAADTIGVFQVESRAQMATLPRVRPRTLYELAIQVALIRPGPIQGQMVHPYIRRRNGEEEVTYPHTLLEPVLKRTLGVPLFQEQGMRLAIVAANFSPAKADALREAMGSKRSHRRMQELYADLLSGMEANGIPLELGERVCKQLAAFANYGFPESHACAFAALVYISAYLKRHHPAEFTCALLNAQPMGFYQPAVIVNDARRHGVPVLPADVTCSRANCTLEGGSVRLGLRYVRSVGEDCWPALDAAAEQGQYTSVEDFARRTGLGKEALEHLAAAGAFAGLGLARRDALWQVEDYGKMTEQGMLPGLLDSEENVAFPALAPPETAAADYWHVGLSTSYQPISFFRRELNRLGTVAASKLAKQPQGRSVKVAGLVVIRQRPQTAKGFVFCTLEDETGLINVVIAPWVYERYRAIIRTSPMLVVEGIIEREHDVVNVWTRRAWPLSQERLTRGVRSRDFR